MRRRPFLPYLWMLLGTFAFAVMAVLINELKEEVPWQWIALARSSLAMLFGAGLVLAAGAKFVFLRPRTLWMRSLAGSVSLLCGFYAMTHYDVSVVLTLTNMYPLWVAVLSWPLMGELPSTDTWIAAVVGVIGVAVLSLGTTPPISTLGMAASEVAGTSNWSGTIAILAAIVSAMTSAVALIGLHKLHAIDSRAVVTHFSFVSTMGCLGAIVVVALTQPSPHPLGLPAGATSATLLMLVCVGLAATAGQLFLTKAFTTGSPSRISVIGLAQTAITMLFQVILHGQQFSAITLAGMALIVTPTAWVLLRGRAVADEPDPPT
ncbi:MAG: DMT family transporter [Planctomycetales bacterium]|nr:DMT family transporter [Planctomycetales bacterium]